MSTKSLQHLIQRVKKQFPDAGLDADLALLELHTIERAAGVIAKYRRDPGGVTVIEIERAECLIESIAKESP